MKKEKARRSKMLHFAVTEEEARIIDEKMKQLEIRNMSAFLRAMVLNGYVLKLDSPAGESNEQRQPDCPQGQRTRQHLRIRD